MAGVTPDEMRRCILEAFRREPTTQDANLMSAVAGALVEAGLVKSEARRGHPEVLPMNLWRRYRDALWDLMTQGVVTFGSNYSNPDWPHLSLTEYGRECVERDEILPHDRDGYLRALEEVRPMDDTEKRYIPQALAAFHHNLIDASAVMIGCASEHLVYVLADAVIKADPARAHPTEQKVKEGKLYKLMAHLSPELQTRSLPRHLAEPQSQNFDGIGHLIRIVRNDAGHPHLQPVTRDQCFANLLLFRTYRDWVAGVLAHLGCP